jgi:glycerophosphoryl diester phosphodiesterase
VKARRLIASGAAALALALPADVAAKSLFDGVHAHRGGPNPRGEAVRPENSIEAFRAALKQRADVIEIDVRLTADDVPVVIHDATLDRTTNCAGRVRRITAAALAERCHIDTVGTGSLIEPAEPPGARIPTLSRTLAWAKRADAVLNVQVKNTPNDPDYDRTPAFAETILAAIEASGIDKERVLVQSFWPPNLDAAKARGFPTSLLRSSHSATLRTIGVAAEHGYTFVTPGWPTARNPKQFVDSARKRSQRVLAYDINTAREITDAIDAGVDGLITDDVALAKAPRHQPACRRGIVRHSRARSRYRKKLRSYRRARSAAARKRKRGVRVRAARQRKLQRRVTSARRAYKRAGRSKRATCARFR